MSVNNSADRNTVLVHTDSYSAGGPGPNGANPKADSAETENSRCCSCSNKVQTFFFYAIPAVIVGGIGAAAGAAIAVKAIPIIAGAIIGIALGLIIAKIISCVIDRCLSSRLSEDDIDEDEYKRRSEAKLRGLQADSNNNNSGNTDSSSSQRSDASGKKAPAVAVVAETAPNTDKQPVNTSDAGSVVVAAGVHSKADVPPPVSTARTDAAATKSAKEESSSNSASLASAAAKEKAAQAPVVPSSPKSIGEPDKSITDMTAIELSSHIEAIKAAVSENEQSIKSLKTQLDAMPYENDILLNVTESQTVWAGKRDLTDKIREFEKANETMNKTLVELKSISVQKACQQF